MYADSEVVGGDDDDDTLSTLSVDLEAALGL